MGVTIRTARLADRERILAISSQIWEGEDYVPRVIDEWMRMRDSEVAVAELNGAVIAFAHTVNLAPGYVWIEGIRTEPAAQGHGAGKALTEYFIEKAGREGAARIGLSTYIDNLASIHIVEACGFKRQASFVLAEADRESPARAAASLSADVVSIPFDEARAWVLKSKVLTAGAGFMSQGWKFWPVARPGITAWPPLEKAVGLRRQDGSIGSLLLVCRPDHDERETSIDFVDGDPEGIEVLVTHTLAIYAGAKNIVAMIPAGGATPGGLLQTVTALEFNVWQHGDPDVFVYELPLEHH